MNLYLAGGGGYLRRDWCQRIIKSEKINYLGSFHYADDTLEQLIPYFKNFLCDSGAFTFFSSDGKGIDWDNYIKRYADFVKRNKIQHFFELDIDELIGYEKVIYYRKRLEDLTGRPVIPVWHIWRGKDNYLQMCEEYPYIAIGGLVGKDAKSKKTNSSARCFPGL